MRLYQKTGTRFTDGEGNRLCRASDNALKGFFFEGKRERLENTPTVRKHRTEKKEIFRRSYGKR